MKALDVLGYAGITYRQLDYWTRCGYLHEQPGRIPDDYKSDQRFGVHGAGFHRDYSDLEADIASRMGILVAADIKPGMAADLARAMLASHLDTCTIVLPGGGLLRMTYQPPAPTRRQAPSSTLRAVSR